MALQEEYDPSEFNRLIEEFVVRPRTRPDRSKHDGHNREWEDLFAEFAPNGPLEEDIVESIVRLTLRKQNLLTYGMAATARSLRAEIRSKYTIQPPIPSLADWYTDPRTPEQLKDDRRAAEREIKSVLGGPARARR